jgi:hypothetical protein
MAIECGVQRGSPAVGRMNRCLAGAIAVVVAAVSVAACRRSSSVPTEAEQAIIRQEVIQAVQGMLAAEERLDAAAVWAFHADVPGYLWADVDGKLYDFAGTKKAWADYIAGCERIKFVTRRQEVDVLGPDAALLLWQGSADVTQKGGAVSRTDAWTARYLFRRIGSTWKITGGQESALVAQAVPAGVSSATAPGERPARRVVFTKARLGKVARRDVLAPDDVPEHTLVQSYRVDVGETSDADFTIVRELVYGQSDERPDLARFYGYSTYVMKEGDRVFIRWESDRVPQGPRVNGQAPSDSGTIVVVGGTGRYKNIEGRGVWQGYVGAPVVEINTLDVRW